MARKYGQDSDLAQSASEEVNKIREEDRKRKELIEKGIAIFLVGFGFVFFVVKIIGAFGDSKIASDYRTRAEQERQRLMTIEQQSVDETTEPVDGEEAGPTETEGEGTEETTDGTEETENSDPSLVDEDTVVRRYISDNAYEAGMAVAEEQNRLVSLVNAGEHYSFYTYMLDDVVNTYFEQSGSGTSPYTTRNWILNGDLPSEVVWVFDTNYNFESRYIEGSTDGPHPEHPVVVVWRCYKQGDEISRTKLLAYVTAIYHPYTQTYQDVHPYGYFTDVSMHRLTGWASFETDIQDHIDNSYPEGEAPANNADCDEYYDQIEEEYYQRVYGGPDESEGTTPTTEESELEVQESQDSSTTSEEGVN